MTYGRWMKIVKRFPAGTGGARRPFVGERPLLVAATLLSLFHSCTEYIYQTKKAVEMEAGACPDYEGSRLDKWCLNKNLASRFANG